jgi:hypothetical protein
VLVFTPQRQEDTAPALTRWFDSFYRGVNFSTVYALEQGGYVSQTFNNGPVRPQPGLPTPIYYWDDAENVQFITQQCAELLAVYDAVLVWGQPSPALRAALDQCFTPLPPLPDLTVWAAHP